MYGCDELWFYSVSEKEVHSILYINLTDLYVFS